MKWVDYKQDASTPGAASALILCFVTALVCEFLFQLGTGFFKFTEIVSRIVVVFISLYLIHSFALYSLKRYRPILKDLISTHMILIGSLVVVWVGRILSLALSDFAANYHFIESLNYRSLYFAIPVAVGGLVIQSVKGIQYSTLFALSLVSVLAVYEPNSFTAPYILVITLVACLSLRNIRSRSSYVKAGFHIALFALPFAVVSCFLTPALSLADVLIRISGVFISGMLCTFIAAGITPVLEYLGGYVTDIRLIEISTLDQPLLKELSVQAAGTWNHSMVVGMMVEAAADAIGANPVLARVGAYFHDIGKIRKPLYFVENQGGGENRHDKLSTSMSALIIRSHVKDGIELASKHKLPEAIVDMIAQHHGTSVIEFFYNKALQEAKEEGREEGEVDRSLYSYPGPKPQTREAGLLMLADGIEPASRTIAEPTPDRLQGLVQKMINRGFASGQLNECDLTLKDLHQIAKCYTRVLASIYHQRIAYAEPAEKVSNKTAEPEHEHTETSEKEVAGADPANKPRLQSESIKNQTDYQEDLKRLGIQDGS